MAYVVSALLIFGAFFLGMMIGIEEGTESGFNYAKSIFSDWDKGYSSGYAAGIKAMKERTSETWDY